MADFVSLFKYKNLAIGGSTVVFAFCEEDLLGRLGWADGILSFASEAFKSSMRATAANIGLFGYGYC